MGWGFQPFDPNSDIRNFVLSQSLSGWGGVFNRIVVAPKETGLVLSQSLSGWGGVFNLYKKTVAGSRLAGRNPFQGGVGFSTSLRLEEKSDVIYVAIPFRVWWGFQQLTFFLGKEVAMMVSQSLSGCGGVFNHAVTVWARQWVDLSQSLSGCGGVFNCLVGRVGATTPREVAIPFRVWWGFQLVCLRRGK